MRRNENIKRVIPSNGNRTQNCPVTVGDQCHCATPATGLYYNYKYPSIENLTYKDLKLKNEKPEYIVLYFACRVIFIFPIFSCISFYMQGMEYTFYELSLEFVDR